MANTFQSGTIYVDSTGALTALSNLKVAYIIFRSAAAEDAIVLRDGGSGSPIKLSFIADVAKKSYYVDFSMKPILFKDGIYCSVITSGAVATIYTTSEGST